MRDILFRGKAIDGNWYYGVPLVFTEDYTCMTAPHTYNKSVIPSTICQFTGMTDKNGKKIFEGDVVQCNRTFCDGKEMIGYINYSDCCFCIKDIKGINNPAIQLCGDFIIIGNIHDNPELLENPLILS